MQDYLPSESSGQRPTYPTAGQLHYEPSDASPFPSHPIIDQNSGLVKDSQTAKSATRELDQPLADADHILSLKYYWSKLLQNLVVEYVTDEMFSRISTFTMDDMDNITSLRTRKEKAKELLRWLQHHGWDEYLVFLHAINNSQPHLYKMLMTPVPESFKATQGTKLDSQSVYQHSNASLLPTQSQVSHPARLPDHSDRQQPGVSTRSLDQTGSQRYLAGNQ